MKKYLLIALIGLAGFVAILFAVAAFQPKDWSVERSLVINAPRVEVWTIASDLNRYNEWNPYYFLEPESKPQAVGPAATVGSSYSWDGEKSDAGTMTITEVAAPERLDFRLDFLRPLEVTNSGAYVLDEIDGATKMRWVMSGRHEGFPGLVARAIHLFLDMDAMLGASFEEGLNRLKVLSEGSGTTP